MNRKIIDLGCGRTPWPVYAPKEFKLNENDSYTGLDLFPEVIKAAEESTSNLKGKYKFIEGDILESLPFEDNSFTELHFHGINPYFENYDELRRAHDEAEKIDSESMLWLFGMERRRIGPISLEHFLKEASRILIPEGSAYVTCQDYFFYPKPSNSRILKENHFLKSFKIIDYSSNRYRCFLPSLLSSKFLQFSESFDAKDDKLRFFILEKK